jgi:hypothetical protein
MIDQNCAEMDSEETAEAVREAQNMPQADEAA